MAARTTGNTASQQNADKEFTIDLVSNPDKILGYLRSFSKESEYVTPKMLGDMGSIFSLASDEIFNVHVVESVIELVKDRTVFQNLCGVDSAAVKNIMNATFDDLLKDRYAIDSFQMMDNMMDNMIEFARHVDRDHVIHDCIEDATIKSEQHMRSCLFEYVKENVLFDIGVLWTKNKRNIAMRKNTNEIIDHFSGQKKLTGFEAFLTNITTGEKAQNILADYGRGLTTLKKQRTETAEEDLGKLKKEYQLRLD